MIPNFRPLNPWGRPMPKPGREIRASKPSLYQVHVDVNATGADLAIGPRLPFSMLPVAEALCEAIGREIAKGRERTWSNPRIVETKFV